MEKNLLKKSGRIAVIITFSALAFWFGFAKLSLGLDTSNWTPYDMRKDSTISEQLIILCGTSGSGIVFGTTSGAWVGTPTDSTLARIGLNTGTGKLEIKNAGTDTASPIVKYHDDLSGVTANQHHAQVHGAADHSGNIGTETQITFGTQTGHAHTGTDSTKVSYPNLLNRSHGAADHSGNIGTESQIAYGTETGHAHTGTDSTKVQHSQLAGMTANDHHAQIHGAADHTGNIGTETQITFGTASGHSHNGSDSTKIDYDTAPVQLGTDTAGNSDNISEGSTNKYYTDDRVATVIGSSSITSPQVSPKITFTSPAVGQFLKIVDSQGNVENGTSSASVDFSAVLGSASANSNFQPVLATDGKVLIGLSDVIKLPATTTAQSAQSYGQLYTYLDSYNIGGNDSNTKLLLHMDNPGTSTTVDASSSAHIVTANGSVIGTSTAPVYGSGRGYFNGTNAYYELADSDDWTYGSGSFMLEAKIQPTSVGDTAPVIFQKPSGSVGSVEFGLGGPPPSDYVFMTIKNSSDTVVGNYRSTAHVGTETPTRIAFIRNGSSNKIYVNGVAGTTILTELGATTLENLAQSLMIGFSNTTSYFPGYIEEVRISKGVPRHTSDYVPPGVAYEDTAGRYNLRIVNPESGGVLVQIQTGTASVTPTIAFNTTHTIVGSTTSAYASDAGTTTYALLVDSGKSISQDWVFTPSSSKVKTDLPGTPTTEALDIVRGSDGHKFLYKDKLVSDARATTKALNDYISEDEEAEFELYKEVYQNEYIEGEVGSQSVNYRKMKNDFSLIHANNKTVEWIDTKFVAGKSDRIKRTKAYLEMDGADLRNNTANYGIMIDRNCPPEILDVNGLPSTAKWLGLTWVATKGLADLVYKMKAELGSATAEIEALKKLINPNPQLTKSN